MLKSLHIENYLLIEELDLTLQNGLNVITGETGAGKSILLGAMALVLGERADSGVIRPGAQSCVAEAVFRIEANSPLKNILAQNDIEENGEVTVRRMVTPVKSRAFINDMPVNLMLLKEAARYLVDIHSQHQTLLVGDTSFQTEVVDSVAANEELLEAYLLMYTRREELARRIRGLKAEAERAAAEEEYLRFQEQQLREAKLAAGEEEELTRELELLSRAAEISQKLFETENTLGESDNSTVSSLGRAVAEFSKICTVLPEGEEIARAMESALIDVKESLRAIGRLRGGISENPERLAEVEKRLDLISTLEQKHRKKNVEELLELYGQIKEKLGTIDDFDDSLENLRKEERKTSEKAREIAAKISLRRKTVKEKIEKSVVGTLRELGMAHPSFEVVVEHSNELLPNGSDIVFFNFSANADMPLEKIDKVASGGEMSRLMLALKMLVSERLLMPTMVFDEIDIGVSGRVADKMGEIMEQIAAAHQIINITHLPQVASKGDHHYLVYKESGTTNIVKLAPDERIEQIAVMISGSRTTVAAIEQAKELLTK